MTLYNIDGITCQACVQKIKKALSDIDGVEVSLTSPHLTVPDENSMGMMELQRKLSAAGNYILYAFDDSPDETAASDHESEEEEEQSHTKEKHLSRDNPAEGGKVSSFQKWAKTYKPLVLIISYIFICSFAGALDSHDWMFNFMAGFFLVFSFFKLLDIHGFANTYATYDILAAKWHTYGYIYPFLELLLGLAFLFRFAIVPAIGFSIILMAFGCIGVIKALRAKQEIRCACLGTTLNLPMSTVTLIENLSMIAMSCYMLPQLLA